MLKSVGSPPPFRIENRWQRLILLLFAENNSFLAIILTLSTVLFSRTADGLSCFNYSSTVANYLPPNAPVATGCRSCSRGIFSAQWPSRSPTGEPDVYSWTCSNLAVYLPGYHQSNNNDANSDYPPDQECVMGSYEMASPSAGYLALCTCCADLCNSALTCKTYPGAPVYGDEITQIIKSSPYLLGPNAYYFCSARDIKTVLHLGHIVVSSHGSICYLPLTDFFMLSDLVVRKTYTEHEKKIEEI